MLSIHNAPSVRSLRKSFASHLPHHSATPSSSSGGNSTTTTTTAATAHISSSYSHKTVGSASRSILRRVPKEDQYQVEIVRAPSRTVGRGDGLLTTMGAETANGLASVGSSVTTVVPFTTSTEPMEVEDMLWLSRPGEVVVTEPHQEESLPSVFNHRTIIDRVCDNFCFSLIPMSDPRASSVPSEFRNKSGVPAISLKPYLERLVRYANAFTKENEEDPTRLSCGVRSLFIAAELVERCSPHGISEDAIHRLFASAFLVAIKSHEDARFSNQYWAKVAGVDTFEELNAMEIKFLSCCNWNVTVSNEEFCALANKFK